MFVASDLRSYPAVYIENLFLWFHEELSFDVTNALGAFLVYWVTQHKLHCAFKSREADPRG